MGFRQKLRSNKLLTPESRRRPSAGVEQAPDATRELSSKPSSASEAFKRAPNSGKLAARFILEQSTPDEAELILETFRGQQKKSDEIFPEAAWCELLLYLGDERVEEAQYYFGWISASHPQMNEAEEYATRYSPARVRDQEAVEANPGNGWRVHRLISNAKTVDEVEALYQDFMSQPNKSREALVFASYWMKRSNLDGINLGDCWAQMTAEALKHEREFMNRNFERMVIEEAGKIQRIFWPE